MGLEMSGIGKTYGGVVRALHDVSIEAREGEVLALMGENGAGKSTLLKILAGAEQPSDGVIRIDGESRTFGSPADAHASGVRIIYQEPEIIPHVSVAENVYAGILPGSRRFFDRRALRRKVMDDLDRYGFQDAIDPDVLGRDLSPAQRQLVEILRALIGRAQVIAFDEPTSSLSQVEVQSLFRLIGRLRDDGIAVVYVSHRMQEIFAIADRVTVLRDGAVVGSRLTAETTEQDLISMMVGRDLSQIFNRSGHDPGDVVLRVEGLTSDDVHDISFEVRSGEVLGIAGLVGAGRSELAHAIVANERVRSGTVTMRGKRLRLRSPRDAIRAGIGFAPEERKAQALFLHRSVRDNVSIAVLDRVSKSHVIRQSAERKVADEFIKRLSVRTTGLEQPVANLSGGNQQKVVLARWLARRPSVLILDEPTRGIDVGAKSEIYDVIDELATAGIAVIVISSELPEVLSLADRIVVMNGGRITGELSRTDATEERVLELAMKDAS